MVKKDEKRNRESKIRHGWDGKEVHERERKITNGDMRNITEVHFKDEEDRQK